MKSCSLCGYPRANPIIHKDSPKWYLCSECEKNYKAIKAHIQKEILCLHKTEYAYVNVCKITKQKKIGKITPRSNLFIEINPQKIIQNTDRGNNKTNYTFFRNNECTICGDKENLTAHHLFKRAVFGKKDNRCIVTLCHDCHIEVEKEIDKLEKTLLEPLEGIFVLIQSLLLLKKINFKDKDTFLIYAVKKKDSYSFSFKNRIP